MTTDRKRISVHTEEFEALNEARGDIPWTAYLRGLREDDAEPVEVHLAEADKHDIIQAVADEIEARFERR